MRYPAPTSPANHNGAQVNAAWPASSVNFAREESFRDPSASHTPGSSSSLYSSLISFGSSVSTIGLGCNVQQTLQHPSKEHLAFRASFARQSKFSDVYKTEEGAHWDP
eukprot:802012-Rhodomonas_salina.2